MLIEAVKPLKVKLPTGEIHLTPGVPVELPTMQAQQLLAKAEGKVRVAKPSKPDWLSEWQTLARMTYGITAKDPRFQQIMAAMYACDNAFLAGNWHAFQESAEEVKRAIESLGQSNEARQSNE